MRPPQARHLILLFILLAQFTASTVSSAAPPAQTATPEELAQQLLTRLTPEERIGQLFMVEFQGAQISEESPIYNLITQYHIGGVVFKYQNQNFPASENPLLDTWLLTQELQRTEISNSRQQQTNPVSGETFSPALIPLFIAVTQDGGGFPNDQILTGVTPLPNPLAIGATWNPDLAYQTGEILGQELNTLGFNMLLGPSLNVNVNPRPDLAGDLGTNSFGGSPYWVGKLGSAYIQGVHQGSSNRIAVISKDFPGFTGADRPPSEEIPTVRKTLEQLIQTELQPFYQTTGKATTQDRVSDGLLLMHAKYQAFQSNITTATRPITLDPQAFEQLITLPEIASWYDQNGLVVSDELGSPAIRRYFEQLSETYSPRLIARDALLAGNDLLLLGNFIAPNDPDAYTTIIGTLQFFAQKYRDDLAFAQRVDEALLRILTLKYKLYNSAFDSNTILTTTDDIDTIGTSDEITFEIARQASTLLNPSAANLNSVLPNPPSVADPIVIISDSIEVSACTDCPAEQVPSSRALESVALRLYGPSGDGLLTATSITSYTFADLELALESPNDPENALLNSLRRARWVVFMMLDVKTQRPSSLAIRRFLSERPELIQNKKTIVFALNAPYYLDATDIPKVTAYYGLYSKQPQFIEVAARLLFQELSAPGKSPVSISGIGYVLESALQPNPTQVIPLVLEGSNEETKSTDEGLEATPAPIIYTQGQTISILAGPILDYNSHSVPNNTLVRFTLTTTNLDGVTSQRELSAFTSEGLAKANYILDTAGVLQMQVFSGDPAATSEVLQIDVTSSGEISPDEDITPTPLPPTPEPTQAATPVPEELPRETNNVVDWLLSLIVIAFVSLFAYQAGAVAGQIRWGIRWGLASLVGGLLVNAYLSFSLPGTAGLIREYHIWGIVLGVGGGCLLGWGFGLLWRLVSRK